MTFSLLEDDSDCISVTTVNVSKGVATGRNLDFFFFWALETRSRPEQAQIFFWTHLVLSNSEHIYEEPCVEFFDNTTPQYPCV